MQERVREVNRVQGVLERANIKLAFVISDIMGVSGRAMLEALIAGRAAPAAMAELAKRRMRSKIPLIEQALTGVVHAHHRQLLAMQLAHIDFLDSIGFFIFVFDMQAVPSHMGTVNKATDTYSARLPTGRMACAESPEVL